MTVTNIVRKNNGKQYDIYIDNILKLTVDFSLLLTFDIKRNMHIDEEWLRNIESQIQYEKAYEYSIRLLTIGDKTSEEVRRKLRIKNYSEVIIDRVINKLSSHEYIDDERYIERWISYKLKTAGMSKKAMYYKLLQKGLSKELLDKKFNEIEIDEYNIAFLAAEKKVKTIKGDTNQIKAKLFSFLNRKGFDRNICFKVINELIKNNIWD